MAGDTFQAVRTIFDQGSYKFQRKQEIGSVSL